MAGLGDYTHFTALYTDKTTDIVLAAADSGKDNIVAVKSASHQLWIQKILFTPFTVAAQAIIIQDDAGTPLVIGTVPASQSTPLLFDYGPKGRALTVGKNLDLSGTAGPGMSVHIEAYEKLGAVISHLAGAGLQ